MLDEKQKQDELEEQLAATAKKYWESEGWAAGGKIRPVDYAKATAHEPALAGIKIVDCDTHLTEAPDLWTSRASATMKDRMPRIERIGGADHWRVGNRDFGSMGGNVISKDKDKLLGRLAFPTLEEGHAGSWNTKARLEAMDELGVYAQMCYHNSGVTQHGALMMLGDNALAVEIIKIYNDAAAERQAESGNRLFTLAHLPIWDKAEMLKEARRAFDMGLKGFVLPDMPEKLGIPPFLDLGYWHDLLQFINDSGMPINFHLNAGIDANGLAWTGFNFERRLAVVATMYSIGNAATLGNWIVSGHLDRFPKLKIGLIESGMGWVPFALEALEHQFDEMMPVGKTELTRRPWQYWKDHFWCTFWFESVGPKRVLEDVGFGKVLFETDFPHPTSLYPGVQSHIMDALGGYTHEQRKMVLQDNAVGLYNLPF
jgi:predicted TIM-barrel fold metal-dependent hydrolase